MGVSTDAILVFGIALKEDAIEPFPDDSDEDGADRASPSYMAYSGNEVRGISIVTHQHCDYPIHIVAARETTVKAWRGHPRGIMPEHILRTTHKQRAALMAYVRKHKLAVDTSVNGGDPGWILCSYWDG
jgi:hypothetical protein